MGATDMSQQSYDDPDYAKSVDGYNAQMAAEAARNAGDSDVKASSFGLQVDPSNYVYGGNSSAYYNQLAGQAEGRQATFANYGQANAAAAQGQQAMGAQQNALSMDQQAAMGNAPSVAALQQQQGLDAAQNGAQSIAAGARGNGAGLAQILASQSQGTNAASAVNSAAQLRAGEMATARAAYSQDATGLRNSDLASQQQAAAQAQFQATQQLDQTKQNDAYSSSLYGNEQTAAANTLQGTENQAGQDSTNYNSAAATNAGVSIAGQQNQTALVSGGAQAGASLVTGIAMLAKNKTNSSDAGYLSGAPGQATSAANTGAASSPTSATYGYRDPSLYQYGGNPTMAQAPPQTAPAPVSHPGAAPGTAPAPVTRPGRFSGALGGGGAGYQYGASASGPTGGAQTLGALTTPAANQQTVASSRAQSQAYRYGTGTGPSIAEQTDGMLARSYGYQPSPQGYVYKGNQ